MDFFIEFFLEVLLEGSLEIATNKRIHRAIRYTVAAFALLLALSIVLVIAFIGIRTLVNSSGRSDTAGGIVLIAFDIFLIVIGILAVREKVRDLKCKNNKK